MKVLLAVPALALIGAPALANPDIPYKAEVRMHASTDGRADLHVDHSSRPDAYDRTVTNARGSNRGYDRPSTVVLPLKIEARMKLGNGDDREGSGAKAQVPTTVTSQPANNPYAGLRSNPPPIPYNQVAIQKMQNGDRREEASSPAQPSASSGGQAAKHHVPLSRHEKEMLCKMTHVCMPLQLGSDDPDDKAR
jgi:hypothetical protein